MEEKKTYENGIHDISIDDYHNSLGLSRSALMEFKRSPFHYWYKFLCNPDINSDSSNSMDFGNLVHCLVLEPHKFHDNFLIKPAMDRRTNAGKLAFNQFTSILAGRIGVTHEQIEQANAIAKAVKDNEIANALLTDCHIEKSIYFTHSDTGIQCKARPDAWNGSIVVDLKTTNDASYRAFQASAFKFGYFLQAGMIYKALFSIGVIMEKYVILAVEKEPPYALAIYDIDYESINYGIGQFDKLMTSFAHCQKNDKWPGFGLQTLTIPGYANFEVEMEYEHE